jgi:23S rRNA (uracil1939-C5)-methyltransferase
VARALGPGTGEPFRALVESLDQDGRGVAHRDGKAVFIEGALPGERVLYERRRNKPSYEVGRVVRIERASSLRVEPRCPHAGLHPGACGGCSMQHVEARAQIAIKQRVLEDTLWHLGRVRPERLLRPVAGPAWEYRHRARFSVRHVPKKGGVLVGFHERASSYVADIRQCEVVPRHVSDLLLPLRALVESLTLRDRLPQIELAVAERAGGWHTVLVFRVLAEPTSQDRARLRDFGVRHGIDVWLQPHGPASAAPLEDTQADHLEFALPEFAVRIPFKPTDFTQVNHRINEVLVARAVRLLDPRPDDVVADFFCGLGNFTLPLATRARRAIGVEGSEVLLARAQEAAALNGLAQSTAFEAADIFQWTPADWKRLTGRHGRVARVLIDPPREGALALARSLAAAVAADRPVRVVYVSCNPATLARDCAVLVHEGGWRVRAAGVVNMFPHTSHVESIALLEPPT